MKATEKPAWVLCHVEQWAKDNSVSARDYEVSCINGGYYLYKKRTASDKNHTYIGSIKEDGIHLSQPRRKIMKKAQPSKQHVTPQSIVENTHLQSATTLQAYEYGASRTIIQLAGDNLRWKKFYKEDSDTVLLTLIQTISPQSFTTLHFARPEKLKYPLGYARKYLNSLLPISLDTIMAEVGNVYVLQDSDSTFKLSHVTDKQYEFFRKYNISMEV